MEQKSLPILSPSTLSTAYQPIASFSMEGIASHCAARHRLEHHCIITAAWHIAAFASHFFETETNDMTAKESKISGRAAAVRSRPKNITYPPMVVFQLAEAGHPTGRRLSKEERLKRHGKRTPRAYSIACFSAPRHGSGSGARAWPES